MVSFVDWLHERMRILLDAVFKAPDPKTLRIFLVRTGKYQGSHLSGREWELTDVGCAQARAAAAAIAERFGDDRNGLVVLNSDFADCCYRQTAEIIAQELDVPIACIPVENMRAPCEFELEEYAKLGNVLVMVVNGTSLAADLHRYGGNVDNLGVLGPPHGSVHEMEIIYVPATMQARAQELSRRFVA